MVCEWVPFFMSWQRGNVFLQSTYGVSNITHKRESEHIENIRIKEYNEICSEKFRMTIILWRIRGFPLRKNGFFFTSEELG